MMKRHKQLNVEIHGKPVGRLAMTSAGRVAFEYSDEWIEIGFPISPFHLPLKKQVFINNKNTFDGLYGVFADSLPDGWGRLLLRRFLKNKGLNVEELDVLDMLALSGRNGRGALEYVPCDEYEIPFKEYNLDSLAEECLLILKTETTDMNYLDTLYGMGGTSGGARPKISATVDNEEWLIKFPSHLDSPDIGTMEFEYAGVAKKCGIEMPEYRLFPSKITKGYFGTKRFDRILKDDGSTAKKHMLTVAALLETDYRIPSLDYSDLLKLTNILSESKKDIENIFLRMCFNVFAHNFDDHDKNFTFLYDEQSDAYCLAPAYDLTYSSTPFGEHSITVNRKGLNIEERDIIRVGQGGGIREKRCRELLEIVKENVAAFLPECRYRPIY